MQTSKTCPVDPYPTGFPETWVPLVQPDSLTGVDLGKMSVFKRDSAAWMG